MKVIIIYSGKGGVGKTTTTANVAKILAAQKHKVYVLDADVNTPSMPVIFPDKKNGLITVASLGYATDKSIYVTDSAIRSYIASCIDEVNKLKPDYVLIDTPPSVTDVHINLLAKIKPSGIIVVTQPNALSLADVNRTALFFKDRDVHIMGVVENMCTEDYVAPKYAWKVIASIPLNKTFDSGEVYKNNKDAYLKIASVIKNSDAVILENKRRQLFDETIGEGDVSTLPFMSKKDLKFVNLKTWEYISGILQDAESMFGVPDMFLVYNTTERISRMLKAFEHDDEAHFMVTNAPACEIKVLPGEIGQGSLHMAESYYGVPRVKYKTGQGEIVLFPHEVMPVSNDMLLECLGRGYLTTKDGRYLPPIDELHELAYAFGKRVGLMEDYEQTYNSILNGSMGKVKESSPAVQDLQNDKKKGNRRIRKTMTVADFKHKINNP